MNDAQLRRLKQYFRSLSSQQRILDTLRGGNLISANSIKTLLRGFEKLNKEFPDLFPYFDAGDYIEAYSDRQPMYNFLGIKTHLAHVISILHDFADEPVDYPVIKNLQFPFLHDIDLRKIIERDFDEIRRAYISKCWKSIIVLFGGTIEAVLLHLLYSNEDAAKSAESAPKEPDMTRWDLYDLIKVATELQLVTIGVEKLSHPLREYRNLVHPGYELRKGLSCNQEEAKISFEILNMVHRDLTKEKGAD